MKKGCRIVEITESDTLLNVLGKSFKEFSNKDFKRFVKYGLVEVDGVPSHNSSMLITPGQKVIINFTKNKITKLGLDIIYEDKDLIVINKPSGLLSVSSSKENVRTAYRIVSDYIKQNNKNAKVFIVHRLDKDTSGVLLFAKNFKIKERLQNSWNDIVLKREYAAVVEGEVTQPGTIKSYLVEDKFQNVFSTKNKYKGKLAITHYEPVKYKNNKTLLKIDIETGRKNQIRVHMSENSHPILGDVKYGKKSKEIGRLALHATKLYIKDSRSEEVLKFESELPSSIQKLI